ncbi:MAG: HDOD domain-containing protein [Planctomycetota bacterium]
MSSEVGSIAPAPEGLVPEELSEALIARLRAGDLDLPLLPSVATEVLELARRADADAARLAEVLQRDQALAGHVMRLANSASYAARVPIVSLPQAISRLGLTALRDMVVAVAVRGKVFHVPGCNDVVAPMWRHALATAYWAREIARARRSNVEAAFLCGLLHDVGSPVVLQAILDVQCRRSVLYARPVIEYAILHFHGVFGGTLVAGWNMPPAVSDAILYHHDYSALERPSESVLLTHLADKMAAWMGLHDGYPRPPETEATIAAAQVIEDLNIYPDEVAQLFGLRERIAAWVAEVEE